MKILQIGKYYWPVRGGIENVVKILSDGLVKNGVSVRVVVSNRENELAREIVDGVEVVRLPKLFSVLNQPVFAGLKKEIKKYDPDLIHIHIPNPLAAAKIMKEKKPIVVTYHSDIVGKPKIPTKILEFHTKNLLDKASAVISTSENYAKYSKMLQHCKNKVRVIPLSIEIEKYKKTDKTGRENLKEKLGLKDEVVILFIGRFIPYKGLPFLLRAVPMISSKNFKIILGGSGPLENELKILVKNLGIENKIIFFGEPDDKELSNLYSIADIFVLPSHMRSEAFGIVQMEAMAFGVPVVSCNIAGSGVPWVNKNGVSGTVVEPENPKALSDAISKLISSSSLRKKLGKSARKRAEKLFDSHRMVSETLKLYKDVLKSD